jgi:hypothetical protein
VRAENRSDLKLFNLRERKVLLSQESIGLEKEEEIFKAISIFRFHPKTTTNFNLNSKIRFTLQNLTIDPQAKHIEAPFNERKKSAKNLKMVCESV